MNRKAVIFPAVFGVLFFILSIYFVFGNGDALAQQGGDRKRAGKTAEFTPAAESFSASAKQNAKLQNSLLWTFGGKPQKGWNIYVPLVSHAIKTNSPPDSPEFAAKIAKWQAERSLRANGVLDKQTLETFVKYWQSQRLGRSGILGDARLVSAPIANFYDLNRDPNLLQLEKETFAAYKRMVSAAAKDLSGTMSFRVRGELAYGEKLFRIISAYRSPEYQQALRKKEPNAGRGALAKFSAHSTGQALDIFVGGEPVSTKDPNRAFQIGTPAYLWLVKNAVNFGFYPYFYEPWHWEFVPKR